MMILTQHSILHLAASNGSKSAKATNETKSMNALKATRLQRIRHLPNRHLPNQWLHLSPMVCLFKFVSASCTITLPFFQIKYFLLTLPITFEFKFHLHVANPTINLVIDPRANINIEPVTQVFQTLANQTGHSNVRNGLDKEVNNWARWAQMNPTLYGNKETMERLKKAFTTTTN